MSTKQTDDGGAHQPTPTAQRSDGGGPEIPNPRVNRREMLKITGATSLSVLIVHPPIDHYPFVVTGSLLRLFR